MKTLGILVIGIVIISACFYQHSTEASDAQTDYETGFRYYESKDYAEALKWVHKAADQGNAEAQCCLGVMYYDGEGVPRNYGEALKWFRKSADQGDVLAQQAIGWMYFEGKGVSKNLIEAKNWFRKAASQGDEEALKMLKQLTEMGF